MHVSLQVISIGGTIPKAMYLLNIGGTDGADPATAQVPIVHMAEGQSKWMIFTKQIMYLYHL